MKYFSCIPRTLAESSFRVFCVQNDEKQFGSGNEVHKIYAVVYHSYICGECFFLFNGGLFFF